MAEKIVTKQFKSHSVRQITESLTEPANTIYYVFAGRHIEYAGGDSTIPTPTDTTEDLNIDVYRDMIFGKQVTSSDIKAMVRRVNWTANTIYTMYDHRDTDMFDQDFYVAVDEGAYYHIYKCLDNANGAASNAQPTFNDATTEAALFANNDQYYETSDGYQWKYMYTVDDVTFEKFATSSYMPVVANTTVEANALGGSIDVIKVDTHGALYNNYLNSGQFDADQITIGGNSTLYTISGANTQTGFYSNTILYLSTGTGSGQYRRVVNSFANGSIISGSAYVILESSFSTTPDATTTYDISPEVKVTSDGTQTTNCVARAIVNATSSNSIHRVEVIEQGLGYTFANASVLIGSAGNVVTTAVVTPIIPPRGGHGADALQELGAGAFGIAMVFANNESGKISTDNDFRQFGIIKDPKFANVQMYVNKVSVTNTAGSDGTFANGESWYQFTKLRMYSQANVNSSNTTIVANQADAEWDELLAVGQWVYLTDSANNDHHFTTVVSVTANTVELNSAPSWTSSTTDLHYANVTANGIISAVNGTSHFIRSSNTTGLVVQDRYLIGTTSMAVANITGVDINGFYSNSADFSTFTQAKKYVGTTGSGTFSEDEYVYQSNGTANVATGYVHSTNVSGGTTTLLLTNVDGEFTTSGVITGNTSMATMTITDKYSGEIEPNSGDIIFLQNDGAVSRSNTQTETIRIILEF